MHKPTVQAWVGEVGTDFFKRVKRKRVKVEDLEVVDDIVYVDNATLQDAFSDLGFHKVAILASMAGDEARERIFGNLSKKMAGIVRDQSQNIENLDEMEAADAEDELISTIKRIKGLGQ
jgi:flagellar motor switch protein FliG